MEHLPCPAPWFRLKEIVQKTALAFLDVVTSNTDLIGAEVELIQEKDREKKLDHLIKEVEADYEYILLIALPPWACSPLTLSPLPLRDYPSAVRILCLGGVGATSQTIRLIKQSLNPRLEIEGILLTMFDGRNNLSHQVAQEVKKHFKDKVFTTIIRETFD